jgi:hypothetical protein
MLEQFTTSIARTSRLVSGATRNFAARPGEAWLECRMAWWGAVLSVAARVWPLPRALALVAGSKNGDQPSREETNQHELARAIDLLLSADVLMFKPICWKRAAVLHRYLSRSGIATKIIFGVRHEDDGKVAGHAWLEADGNAILEKSPPEYQVTYSFPAKQN